MTDYVITTDALALVIKRLSNNTTIYAPVTTDGVTAFQPVNDAAQIAFEYQNSVVPPKRLLFPQTETLFAYSRTGGAEMTEPSTPPSQVIFGIRPCDARSFTMLDSVFCGEIRDGYYFAKREQTTLIGLACATSCANCFCVSLQGSPTGKEGLDLLLTALPDGFFVETATEKGAALLAEHADLFDEAIPAQQEARQIAHQQAHERIRRHVNVDMTGATLDALFYQPLWNEISQTCVGCSICTFLCPTCHCFDIQDENFGERGIRVRTWDTCSNPEYTLHASGHNPRPGRTQRTRNRIYHKYNYFPKKFGQIACVGCGRCVSKCPVNIDIIEILQKLHG